MGFLYTFFFPPSEIYFWKVCWNKLFSWMHQGFSQCGFISHKHWCVHVCICTETFAHVPYNQQLWSIWEQFSNNLWLTPYSKTAACSTVSMTSSCCCSYQHYQHVGFSTLMFHLCLFLLHVDAIIISSRDLFHITVTSSCLFFHQCVVHLTKVAVKDRKQLFHLF